MSSKSSNDKTRENLKAQSRAESQIIIHCTYTSRYEGDFIGLHNSTFLYPNDMDIESKLLYSRNIPMKPDGVKLDKGERIQFTLVFEGLPPFCRSFDLCEDIPDSDSIMVLNIRRNTEDIYHVDVERD